MTLPLANVQTTDTFQTWLTRTNQIIAEAANSTPLSVDVQQSITANTAAITRSITSNTASIAHSASVGKFIDFGGSTHDSLSATEGRVYFDSTHKSLTVFSEGGIEMELGQNEYIRVYNNSGVPINLGQPLYLSGSTGGVPNAQLANASDVNKYNISGLAANTIPNNSYGWVAVSGVVRGFDTSSLVAGERFFVSPNANGELVTPAPTFPNYPMCVGLCVTSDAANGSVVIEQQNHSVPSFRVINNAYIGNDLTVAGNFNVLGSETITTLSNISVSDTFIYLNSGDTVTANTALATGLKDLTFKGHYEGGNTVTYYVKIDSTGGGVDDKFSWSLDNFSTTEAANVAITGAQQALRWGISVQFIANTGHTAGDIWTGTAAPLNVDTGWASNRNPGHAAGGYTHLGIFHDVTDNRFRVFQSYGPEVEGTINISDPTFEYGSMQANTFYGQFNGDGSSVTGLNATQLTSGTVPEARLTVADTSTKGIASFSSDNFAVAAGVVTIKNDGVILGTETTGNYVATVANTDNNITVSGSGSETAAVSVGLADAVNISGAFTSGGTITGGTLTDGTASLNGGTISSGVGATFSGTVQGGTLTDGTLSINSGAITSGVSGAFSGTVTASDFNTTSDARLKKNIKPIDGALSKVMALAGVEFDWVESDKAAIGVIAQQVEEVVPELVHTNESGYKSVSYGNLAALLIEAVKELKTIVDNK